MLDTQDARLSAYDRAVNLVNQYPVTSEGAGAEDQLNLVLKLSKKIERYLIGGESNGQTPPV